MDDDLMSLRGAVGEGSGGDEGPFNEISAPGDLGPASPGSPASGDDAPEWLRELGGLEDSGPATPPAGEPVRRAERRPERTHQPRPKPAPQTRTKSSGGLALGLTPQQRMVLSLFLFLDVSVLGFLILLAIGAINF